MKRYITILAFVLLGLAVRAGLPSMQTFRNPVLWADVPDPDVIRVGDTFYMVSTTMHLMPGAPIMRSKNLVDWETVNYMFPRLTDSPKYDMQGGTVYGRGQWATSLKYFGGRFYALFAPNDTPGGDTYIYTAQQAEGEWTLVSRLPHFHDASLFFDDDGTPYVVYGTGELVQLSRDLMSVVPDSHQQLFERDAEETGLLEGSRMVKHRGRYYLLMISWPQGRLRREVCYRADNIRGTYTKQVILEKEFGGFGGVGQGTIVDTQDGRWYGIIFQDRGGVGRVLTLMPCTWTNDWPMLSEVPEVMDVPILTQTPTPNLFRGKGSAQCSSAGSERGSVEWFDALSLLKKGGAGLGFQWNHNPIDSAWSLTEREGCLRLKTSRIVDNFFLAPNTLTTRTEGPACEATIKLDVSRMHDGDVAGFAAMQGDAALLSVVQEGRKRFVVATRESVALTDENKEVSISKREEVVRTPLKKKAVWLRIACDFRSGRDLATLSYSIDGKTWHTAITDFKLVYDYRRLFMGTRFAIYNYATRQPGGYVDVQSFDYHKVLLEE